MSEFWNGFIALPLVILGAAIFSVIVFGGWYYLEMWRENRWVKSKPKWEDDIDGTRFIADMDNRDNLAAVVLLAPKAIRIKLGLGAHLVLVKGTQHIGRRRAIRAMNRMRSVAEECGELHHD